MTLIVEESEIHYPTGWQGLELTPMVEYRQLGTDLYELRSETHKMLLNEAGFILFMDDTLQGQVIFEDWCRRRGVVPIPRGCVEDGD